MSDAIDVPAVKRRGRPPGSKNKSSNRAGIAGKASARERLKEQKQTLVQEQILEAAAALIAARGFRAVTIDDISASLGFTKSVIYYYLKSKNDILWRIFSQMYEKYLISITEITDSDMGPEKKLDAIVRAHALNVMNNRDWTKIYFKEEAELNDRQRRQITSKKRQYDQKMEEVYKEGVAKGVFKDIPLHLAVSGILGSVNWIYTWYNPSGKISSEEIAEHYVNLLSAGYRA